MENNKTLILPNSNNFIRSVSVKSNDKFIVTHIGALGCNHHIGTYLEAIKRIARNDIEFWFVGSLTTDVLALLENCNLPNVKYKGQLPHNELQNIYNLTDLGVILYKDVSLNLRYCAPNKLYEYWSNGIPVLGDLLPGLKSVFINDILGKLIDMSKPSEIEQSINSFAKKEEERSEKIISFFEQNYKLDNFLSILMDKIEAAH